jgi:hypothetical protein
LQFLHCNAKLGNVNYERLTMRVAPDNSEKQRGTAGLAAVILCAAVCEIEAFCGGEGAAR